MTARPLLLSIAMVLTVLPRTADDPRALPTAASHPVVSSVFDGLWSDGRGGILYFESPASGLTAVGKDAETIFMCSYTIAGRAATGHGYGFNHALGKRFDYSSTLTMLTDSTLAEDWNVTFVDAPGRRGHTVFSRKP